ncbi:hypothetical protein [Nocardia ninae]|uniref:Uncharacterized protein n=1 Tax=Nocardia ninae NBRC 108245 TaxID=1210091 RepID=A0A511MPS8_9NOCA|nr:hypothetical protein [Nocardia ninae]GEM42157.1 hypothetical protein NN4_66760 [Nocardia ninae NBRC 108245]
MSDVSSPASPETTDALPFTRRELIEAIYELSRHTTVAHPQDPRPITMVDSSARELGAQILGNIRARQALGGGEAARAEVVVTELLDGGESRYAWERIADPEMYEAWVNTQAEHPEAGNDLWLSAAGIADIGQEFPDALFLAPINADPRRAVQMSRDELRLTIDELVEHVTTDPQEYEVDARSWEIFLRERAEAIVSTIREGEVVSAGEAARLERLVASAVSFEQVRGTAGQGLWELACDPDAYQTWLQVRAVSIQHAISADPLDWTNSAGEFVDAIRLRPFRADSLAREDHQILDRAGVERAFAEIAAVADPFMDTTRLSSGSQNLDGAEQRFAVLAENILATARHSGTLTASEAGRAERVIASLAAGEYSPEIATEGRVWELVTNTDAYTTWMTERNMRLHNLYGAHRAPGIDRDGQFRNAPGLKRIEIDPHELTELQAKNTFLSREELLDRIAALEVTAEEIDDLSAHFDSAYGEADQLALLEEQRDSTAAEILYTVREGYNLSQDEQDRAERVVAALVHGERIDIPNVLGGADRPSTVDLIGSPQLYQAWLDQRIERDTTERDVMAEQVAQAQEAAQQRRAIAGEIQFEAPDPDRDSEYQQRRAATITASRIIHDPSLAGQLLAGENRDEVVAALAEVAHEHLQEWQSLQTDYRHARGEMKTLQATIDKAAAQAISDQRELRELRADRDRLQSTAMDFAADLGMTPARPTVPQAMAPVSYSVAPSPEFPVPVNTQSVEPSAPWWRPLSHGLGLGGRAERGASR